ncbi:type IV secretion system protein VirB5 [Mesorhizobium hawassense]|uniref:Type IV secretion system protein VirB5 n=1 Tax=Mesorhizobium hawassense TaxID=1209954 RepID=A0A330H0M9_9HYPH|nr:type IV secretion system protein VirB5 [Mesorhizobium hawassense]RAZ82153.1 type IV secretion system protein VirB5 [Mesorhizobium hawassense]
MRFAHITAPALAALMALQQPARAQFMVSDPVTETQTTLTAFSSAATVTNTAMTVAKSIELLQMLSSTFAVTGLLTSLNQPSRYPAAGGLGKQMFDGETLGSRTARAVALDKDRTVTGSDAEAALLREQIAGAANAIGIAADNLEQMDRRLKENSSTLNQLSRTRNIMQATVTNGLLLKQIHDAIIQNIQATSLLTMTTAQAGLHDVEEAAKQRQERQKTAAIFGPLP